MGGVATVPSPLLGFVAFRTTPLDYAKLALGYNRGGSLGTVARVLVTVQNTRGSSCAQSTYAQKYSCVRVLSEKFSRSIHYFPEIVTTSKRLVDGAKMLNIPIFVTEQYPKGLGHTVPELRLQDVKQHEKTRVCEGSRTPDDFNEHSEVVLLLSRFLEYHAGVTVLLDYREGSSDFLLQRYTNGGSWRCGMQTMYTNGALATPICGGTDYTNNQFSSDTPDSPYIAQELFMPSPQHQAAKPQSKETYFARCAELEKLKKEENVNQEEIGKLSTFRFWCFFVLSMEVKMFKSKENYRGFVEKTRWSEKFMKRRWKERASSRHSGLTSQLYNSCCFCKQLIIKKRP
ncbi:unnamed protein product [Cylicocyclus nassatus]|uniref:Uncharacterized protein n=1 Tax=Cylicocyclus nassatus TaxID=53992 RepID=A0AA36H9P7_CYLNA|nr:unnamed protein product [Cylicocyclus nassatus]